MEKINTFICVHLNYEGLKKTLESIRKHTPPNFNIILIDQNKEYQAVDDLVDLHIFTNGKNLGYAKAFNTGCRLADTKYVSCWNDDCECINKKWWQGVEETFKRYSTALGVNPSSPCNPRASGEAPIYAEGWKYKEEYTEEEYDKMVEELGKGYIIDGICMFATVLDREKLDKTAGVIPGKCWLDERFAKSGGEDMDFNIRSYRSGYRMLGTGLSYVLHHWYRTKRPEDGKAGVKYDGTTLDKKWNVYDGNGNLISKPNVFGKGGKSDIPLNTIRNE